jgi:hypothetical protein
MHFKNSAVTFFNNAEIAAVIVDIECAAGKSDTCSALFGKKFFISFGNRKRKIPVTGKVRVHVSIYNTVIR